MNGAEHELFTIRRERLEGGLGVVDLAFARGLVGRAHAVDAQVVGEAVVAVPADAELRKARARGHEAQGEECDGGRATDVEWHP
jgi:hypothetical protein